MKKALIFLIWVLRFSTLFLIIMYTITAINFLQVEEAIGWNKYGYLLGLITLIIPVIIIYLVVIFRKNEIKVIYQFKLT